jgi:hypothetical protein
LFDMTTLGDREHDVRAHREGEPRGVLSAP